jgi:hypothetical protein
LKFAAFAKAFEDPEPKARIAAVVAVGYIECRTSAHRQRQ